MQTYRFRLQTLVLMVGLIALGLALVRYLSRAETAQLDLLVPILLTTWVLELLLVERRQRNAETHDAGAPDEPSPGIRP
jgi:hypothetical protein